VLAVAGRPSCLTFWSGFFCVSARTPFLQDLGSGRSLYPLFHSRFEQMLLHLVPLRRSISFSLRLTVLLEWEWRALPLPLLRRLFEHRMP